MNQIHTLCALGLGLALTAGCNKSSDTTEKDPESAEQTTASAKSGEQPQANTARPKPKDGLELVPTPGGSVSVLKGKKPQVFSVPLDPPLGIFRGKGVGAIRFGATRETIERLMGLKCVETADKLCRYPARAIEFQLDDAGVLDEIRIHGDERPIPGGKPEATFGVYNGRFVEGAALGMYSKFVVQELGKPNRIETLEEGAAAPYKAVERHHYDDMLLEYDTLENGNVVLAGITLKRPQATAAGKSGSAAAPKAGGAK